MVAKYTAYNKMVFRGKTLGKPYSIVTARTKSLALEMAREYNARWNRVNKSQGYRAVIQSIKKR